MNNIPAHLQRLASQQTDLTSDSGKYTQNSLPRLFDLASLPGATLLKALRKTNEFETLQRELEPPFDSADNDQWLPKYYLGGGGNGSVGVYIKRDSKGNIIDELALKETHAVGNGSLWDDSASLGLKRRLLREAVIQTQLNQKRSENITHLRAYKYFWQVGKDKTEKDLKRDSKPPDQEIYRLYEELAPHGDLHSLIERYRYWNQYLPEPFLWHVFDSLADAVICLRDCDWANMPTTRNPRGPPQYANQVVNYDIKPPNIFLSYPDHRVNHGQAGGSTSGGTTKYDYPVVKLGDFGICNWTGHNDPDNLYSTGTSSHICPECVDYGAYWDHIPGENHTLTFTEDIPSNPISSIHTDISLNPIVGSLVDDITIDNLDRQYNYHVDEKLHVWGIGKVMYDLMSLANPDDYWKLTTVNRGEFIANGHHQLKDFDTVPFAYSFTASSPYSKALTDAVAECLRPFYQHRWDVDTMKKVTVAAVQRWDNDYTPDCEDFDLAKHGDAFKNMKHPKLFYQRNDINDMPRGDATFIRVKKDGGVTDSEHKSGASYYRVMQHHRKDDPDWPELKPTWDADTAMASGRETHHQAWLRRWQNRDKKAEFRSGYRPARDGLGGLSLVTPQSVRPPVPPRSNVPNVNDSPQYANNSPRSSTPFVYESPQYAIDAPRLPAPFVYSSPRFADDDDDRGPPPGPAPQPAPLPVPRPQSVRRDPTPSPSPPPSPPRDPTDYITDSSDSEVELAIRTFRNGRRVSYYRPKGKKIASFNRKYLRKRHGESVNAKIGRQDGQGSRFDDAVRRRRQRRETLIDARRKFFEQKQNRQQVTTLPTFDFQYVPGSIDSLGAGSDSTLKPSTIASNQSVTSPQPPQIQFSPRPYPAPVSVTTPPLNPVPQSITTRPLNPVPNQTNWTSPYRQAHTMAQAGTWPAIPPGQDPTDRTFNFNTQFNVYMRQDSNNQLWAWNVNVRTGVSRWLLVPIRADTEANRRLGRVGMPYLQGG